MTHRLPCGCAVESVPGFWVSVLLAVASSDSRVSKQKTPEVHASEVFTNRITPSQGVNGGRSAKCA